MKNLIFLINLRPSTHRTAEECLGVQYLASILENEKFEVQILDTWLNSSITNNDVYEIIIKQKDDIIFVGTSSYMLSNTPTLEIIKKLKKNEINIISGGYGPTFEADNFLLAGAEFVCIGEGEKTIIDIANYFLNKITNKNELKGVAYIENNKIIYTDKQQQLANLDDIPFPKRPFIELIKRRKSTVNVLTSRGCLGQCSFCSISSFGKMTLGVKWRGRSINNILYELNLLNEQGFRTIKFVDDSFIENERDNQWCKNFADALESAGLNLQLRASVRADRVNMDNMQHLKRAGFFSFSCGIENFSESALRRMGKRASLKDNLCAIRCFREYGFYVQSGFILFDDKTTLDELKENCFFMSEYIDLVTKGIFSEMFAAEGTVFTSTLRNKSKRRFSSNTIYEIEDENSRKAYMYLKKWQSTHIGIYDKVIDPISAPKAIDQHCMKKYHELMMKMKRVDLVFMRELIQEIEQSNNLDDLFNRNFKQTSQFFKNCESQVNEFYRIDGLKYDADVNKFILLNSSK